MRAPAMQGGVVDLWDDEKIAPRENFLRQALASGKVANDKVRRRTGTRDRSTQARHPAVLCRTCGTKSEQSPPNRLFLAIDVGQPEGLLAVVLDLQLVFLVESDFADRGQTAGALTVLIEVKNDDAEGIVAGTRVAVEFGKSDVAVGDENNVLVAGLGWVHTDETHAGADRAKRSDAALVFHVLHGVDDAVLPFLLENADEFLNFAVRC